MQFSPNTTAWRTYSACSRDGFHTIPDTNENQFIIPIHWKACLIPVTVTSAESCDEDMQAIESPESSVEETIPPQCAFPPVRSYSNETS